MNQQHIFFYEDIVNNPKKEFEHMVKILHLERTPDKSDIIRPSQQASSEMETCSFRENHTRWMKSFNRRQLSEIDNILNFFKVTIYNAYEPMPISRTQDFI